MKGKVKAIADDVKKLYDRNNLVYHNFAHIQDLLDLAEKHNCNLTLGQTLAVLYHDCTYTPGSKDYVEQSIKIMYEQIYTKDMSFYDRNELAIAKQIILDLSNDIPKITIEESKIVNDLHLAILGFEPDIFDEYREALYREYREPEICSTESIYFDNTYYGLVAEFGKNLLSQDTIYYTQPFKDTYGKRAIKNLLRMVLEAKTVLCATEIRKRQLMDDDEDE